ncbi:MAG: hypothetical protein EAZ99_07835 [Alphaproteobacteria bacterium]|nr:MAG: hypothetical protein EAZ99_07835 [Alphaproteobacteria bacterium]
MAAKHILEPANTGGVLAIAPDGSLHRADTVEAAALSAAGISTRLRVDPRAILITSMGGAVIDDAHAEVIIDPSALTPSAWEAVVLALVSITTPITLVERSARAGSRSTRLESGINAALAIRRPGTGSVALISEAEANPSGLSASAAEIAGSRCGPGEHAALLRFLAQHHAERSAYAIDGVGEQARLSWIGGMVGGPVGAAPLSVIGRPFGGLAPLLLPASVAKARLAIIEAGHPRSLRQHLRIGGVVIASDILVAPTLSATGQPTGALVVVTPRTIEARHAAA